MNNPALLHCLYVSLDDVLSALLPEDAHGEIPVGFAIVGHIGIRYPMLLAGHTKYHSPSELTGCLPALQETHCYCSRGQKSQHKNRDK